MPDGTTIERVYPPKVMVAVANPVMRWLLGTGLGKRLDSLALIEFDGRRTGRRFRVVVAVHDVDGHQAILTNSRWRHNFDGGHRVDATIAGRTRKVVGRLVSDPVAVATVYGHQIEELGLEKAPRRLGIAIHGGEIPSHEELEAVARREGLSIIYLDEG